MQRYVIDLSWLLKNGWVIRPSVFKQLLDDIHTDSRLFEIFRYQIRADKLLFSEISHAAKHDSNVNIEIIGRPGTGKSVLGQSIGYYTLKEFEKYGHVKKPIFATSYSEMNNKLREIAKSIEAKYAGQTLSKVELLKKYISELKGYVLIQDEQVKQHGPGSRIEADNFDNLTKTVRLGQINFILIWPERKLNFGDFVIETVAYHPKKGKNMGIMYTSKMKPIGVIFIKKPESFPWEDEYVLAKYSKVWELVKTGGLDLVRENPIKALKKEIKIEYQGEMEDFEWEEAVFKILKQQDEKVAWIWWLNFVEGKSPRTHLNEYKEKTGRKKSWIYERIKKLNQDQAFWGLIAELRGKLWEDYLAKKYREEGFTVLTEKEVLEKYGEKADLLLIKDDKPFMVINAKCGISGTSYPPEKYNPELNLAKKLKIEAYLEFYNINTRKRIRKRIDLENPKTISF